jgi:hypothetical protein
MKYVFVKKYADGTEIVNLIDNPIDLCKRGEIDDKDQLFQLGQEVKVEMNIKVKSGPVYRGAKYQPDGIIEIIEAGLKGDLGVGDYRG